MNNDIMPYDASGDRLNKMLIPKVLHYCWFGGAPLPDFVKKCIATWRQYCPDYEILEWNESNFDIHMNDFVEKAYQNKKWAFVTDYARLYIIYNNGGIYLDTDVELLRGLDKLLEHKAYMGFEGIEYINTGLGFGAIKGFPLLKEMLCIYEALDYDRVKDRVEKISTPILLTTLLEKRGLVRNGERQRVDGLEIFPEDYFCPKNPITRLINITENTYTIHHYDASWVDDKEKANIQKLEENAGTIMARQSKRVSIIIPVYNGHNYMKEAIDSALGQTYKNIEVIVINDGSNDNTDQIARSYGSRIRYFTKENGGVSSALNLGIRKMRGVYVAWLSHDDKYHPEKIERQVAFASSFSNRTVTVTNWSIIDQFGNHVKDNFVDPKFEANTAAFLAFDRKTWMNGCAMLIPKALFDETLKSTQDYDMWMRLLKVCQFKLMPDHLLYSRAHAEQGSLSMPDAIKYSDMMHSSIIQGLSHDEIAEYFEHSSANYMNTYHNFLYSGYKRTPSFILNALLHQLQSDGKKQEFGKLIHQELIGSVSNDFFSRKDIIKLLVTPKNKKRIMFFTAHWYTGGVERFISNLASGLASYYDITVVSIDAAQEGTIKLPTGINHIRVSNEYFINYYDYIIYALCVICQIDIAIGCMNLFEKVLNFYDLAEGAPFKTIASNHEFYFYPHEHDSFYPLVEKRIQAYKNVDAAIWLTNYSAFAYSCFNKNGIMIANPNTYEIQSFSTKKEEKVILCVGRFNDYVKRIDRIFQCFRHVLKQTPDATLVLVGKCDPSVCFIPNSPKSMNDLIYDLGIPKERVFFEGETCDVSRYYSIASVLLLASDSEGFPMVLNEAACYGVPAVCTYVAGFEDIITDGENGYLVPQDDIDELADKVCSILNDEVLRMRLSDTAKRMAHRFDQEAIANRWLKLFEILLEEKESSKKELLLEKYFGYDVNRLNLYAQNLCEEAHKITRIAYHKKCTQEAVVNFIASNPLATEPLCQSANTSKDIPLIKKHQNRLGLYFHKMIVSYREFGLRITLSKIFGKVMRKLKIH